MKTKTGLGILSILFKLVIGSYIYNEKKLQDKLLDGYDKNILPEAKFEAAMNISLDFILEGLNALDITDQSLDINAFSTIEWYDPQLKWNSSDYGGVDDTVMDPKKIWTPDIALYNSALSRQCPMTDIYTTLVKVSNDGRAVWTSPTVWKSSCSCDITWFPFDNQTCSLKFGSWSYDIRRFNLRRGPLMTSMSNMLRSYHGVSSGEWQITNIKSTDENTTFRCCKNPYATIKIHIELKRKPLYYVIYTLLPIIALVLTFLLIFHLDIGQRASYGVTILLSITVYLLVISAQLPKKSNNWPFIGLTFVIEFFLLCFMLPLAEYSIHIAQRKNGHPPVWMVNFMDCCLFVCCGFGKCNKTEEPDSAEETNVELENVTADARAVFKAKRKHKARRREWVSVGRFLDVIFSILCLIMIILVPVIVWAAIA